ncbi:MAG TPA: glutamate synthase subunit alpha, partial [Armatimonadota bacterium]|nr:glutamate synthase subunit alpha [Armatimonadota bacterium]
EIMAELGFRTVDEMVGRVDRLVVDKSTGHWKTEGLNLSALLCELEPIIPASSDNMSSPPNLLERSLDTREIIPICKPALEHGRPVTATMRIKTTDRTVGTQLGSEISRIYGEAGLPEDTIQLHFTGSAGQSFGAFVPSGITLVLEGDSNDYIGKGLSGGIIAVYPPAGSKFAPEENVIIGNVALYGATGGEAYIRGAAGERFCVRNSGAKAVVEAVGDHGCEYMTGGKVVILGQTGRNFAAGMS